MPAYFNRFLGRYTNTANPVNGTGIGTVVTSGGSIDAQGTAVELISGANASADIWEVCVSVYRGNTSGADSSLLLELLIDPAGGTSYSTWIPEYPVGNADGANSPGLQMWFPRFAPAGSSIAARTRGLVASTTCEVRIEAFMKPTRPEMLLRGTYAEQIGTRTNSRGVTIGTIGVTGSEGTWVSLGTTAKALHWIGLAVNFHDSVIQSGFHWFDLAYGDATNKNIIAQNIPLHGSTTEILYRQLIPDDFHFCHIPASTNIYVRGSTHLASADVCNALAVGIGGGY